MYVLYSKLQEVENLEELPKNAVIQQIDGNVVLGICVMCGEPIFDRDDILEENDGFKHTICTL